MGVWIGIVIMVLGAIYANRLEEVSKLVPNRYVGLLIIVVGIVAVCYAPAKKIESEKKEAGK